MVFFRPSLGRNMVTAFLMAPLSDQELNAVKASFELGAYCRTRPQLEMKIIRPPEEYIGQSHSFIRTKENEAGRTEGFAIIDEQAVRRGAIWYVEQFASEDDVDMEAARSRSVLWEILIKTECFPISWVNYWIANMDVPSDLAYCGVQLPAGEGFEQPEIWESGGLNVEEEAKRVYADVVASPGEYEQSSDDALKPQWYQNEPTMARLTEEVARSNGLINEWYPLRPTRTVPLPDGSEREFPEGCITLHLRYDVEFDWPPYQWPEGSL